MKLTEKVAQDNRSKYVKAMLASAIAAAGIGAVAKNIKERKARAEANNVSSSSNTIVVPILKSRFMDGLPTPDELKKSRGEGAADTTAQIPDQVKNHQQNAELTPDDIASKKKEIIGGRKFDFFGKKAEKSSGSDKTKKAVEGDKKDENGEEGKDGRVLFRDQNGKFVSPSDPVAVESVEKSAQDKGYDWLKGLYNAFAHPIDTAGVMYNAAKDKPVLMTAGAIGSIILATKISDYINKIRRERSKNRLDASRDKYVALLEGGDGEKTAQFNIAPDSDPRVAAGALIGGAFIIPLAITAMVTNRIIENRKNDKKREKEMSDSYPDEPVILYKTSEDKEIRISPETALFAIMVKSAMYESVEAEERKMAKEAQIGKRVNGFIRNTINNGIDKVKQIGTNIVQNAVQNAIPEMSVDEASNTIMKMLENSNNNSYLLSLVRNPSGGLSEDAMHDMAKSENPIDMYRLRMVMNNPQLRSQIINNVKTGKRMQNLIVDRATDDRYADSWGKFKAEKIDEMLTGRGWGLKQGGWLHKIFSWIINNTGLGNYFVKNNINDQFAKMREAEKVPTPNQNALGGTGSAGANGAKGKATNPVAVPGSGNSAGTNVTPQANGLGNVTPQAKGIGAVGTSTPVPNEKTKGVNISIR